MEYFSIGSCCPTYVYYSAYKQMGDMEFMVEQKLKLFDCPVIWKDFFKSSISIDHLSGIE